MKEHPSISLLAAIGGGTTLLLGIALFAINVVKDVMVPTQTASLQNKADSLEKQLSEANSELTIHRKKVQDLESELKVLKGRLVESQAGEIFPSNSPYPNGFGKIKLGDRIDVVTSVFPESSISRKSSYLSVKTEHAFFHDVTYYFEAKEKMIYQLAFFFRTNVVPNTVIRDKLVESSRRPISQSEDCCVFGFERNVVLKLNYQLFTIGLGPQKCA
jgi:hypothetical protein